MEQIRRDIYLKRLIDRRENGLIKIITGIRRCGKSYLLFNLYRQYLLDSGVDASRIISVPLDDEDYLELHDSGKLSEYIKQRLTESGMWYVFLDEVQLCKGFEAVLNGLNRRGNVDIYVTGSNSKFLSSDVLTEFRGRGDEVRIYPLAFSEYLPAYRGDKYDAWLDYYTYGGLPLILSRNTDELKSKYLINLCRELYLKDIEERHNIRNDEVMAALVNILASAVGSLTNANKLAKTFVSSGVNANDKTIGAYIGYLLDAYFISKAERYDIKGKKYIGALRKYYFEDTGLRNVRLGFTQTEINHLMESIVFNELRYRGFSIRVGVIEQNYTNEKGSRAKKQLEIDFYATRHDRSFYIQCTLSLKDAGKRLQEERPFMLIRDSFRKIIIVEENVIPHNDENGIFIIGIKDFLSNKDILEY